MLENISQSVSTETLTRNLGKLFLGQARTEREKGNLDTALALYDQLKETLKSLGSVKEALRKAQDPYTLADETLRAMMADAYFERGEVLKGLNLFAKARSSYLKAEMWGHDEAKQHSAEAVQPPPSGHSAHSSKWASVRTALFTSMSVQKKSNLVDYLFKKALLTLNSLKVSNKPSLFLVYAHNNPDHGKAEAETSKYFIERLSELEGVKLYSDQAPMGRPYMMSPEDLKKDGKLGDILSNQLCLLPAQVIKDVKPVDKAVVCCSEVLGSYLKWADYKKFHQELREAYLQDLEAYGKNNEQNATLAIRKVLRKFSEEQEYKAGFHHVLTEIAFLQIRAEQPKEHGILPVSLTLNSYEECLGAFIKATVVRIEDIPRLEGLAQKGGEVYQNQSRHLVLFKLIERLLMGNNESKTFLDKFWMGHSNLVSRLKNNLKFGELEFTELLDSIFDGIQRAQHGQLASILNQQDQELWALKEDPRIVLKEKYFDALKQDEAFEETLQLYVEPHGKMSLRDTGSFNLLSKVQDFLNDKQVAKKVILLTGDSGAGKTTFNRVLEKKLWDKKKEHGAIPLFISLASINKPEYDLIPKALKKRGMSEFQIQKLKKENQRFVFILDGYDEIRQTQNLYLSNSINQPHGWQGQMVISCRSEYIGLDYQDRFQPMDRNHQAEPALFQEMVIAPFSAAQTQGYIEQYVSAKRALWQMKDYQKALEQIPHLKDLVENPFLLTLALEVLPHLVDPGQNFSVARITRVALYDQFVEQWLERGKKRLAAKDLSHQEKKAFESLTDEGFTQRGIVFLKDLAVVSNSVQNLPVNSVEKLPVKGLNERGNFDV